MTEPISLSQAKRYLRLEDDDPGIADLPVLIRAARQTVEEFLNSTIVVRDRILILDCFPPWAIPLPNGPVKSIVKIDYVDNDGVSQEIPNGQWILSQDVLTPAYGEQWPSTRAQIGTVNITYSAGMMTGASPDTLEQDDVGLGIRLHLTDLWDNRSAVIIGASVALNPTVKTLLGYHRRDMGI